MSTQREKEEYLERLWHNREQGRESLDDLKKTMGKDFRSSDIDELQANGLINLDKDGVKVSLTKKGDDHARRLIRAHRLAERMLHDVIGGDFEKGACEFEHTITPELVDSICILLGHPRECPHGLPIPEGACCKNASEIAHSSVMPLTKLQVGLSARIAYVNCKNDQQLHRIDGLHIRPGAIVKMHQTYPTYVIECEGVNIALDEHVAKNICVWKKSEDNEKEKDLMGPPLPKDQRRQRWRFGFGKGNNR